MIKATLLGIGLVLSSTVAFAQPKKAPAPAPAPTPEAPKPDAPKPPDEKAGTNESLQHGTDDRPWAAGVSLEHQNNALKLFHAGNKELNNGLFENAIKQYRAALKEWEHPAIYYNLALALLKLDQPLEVYDSLQLAIKYGPAPLEADKFEHAQEYMLLVSQQIANVEVTCKKPGAKVSVDGKEVFTVDAEGKLAVFKSRVRIGRHTFIAEKPGVNVEAEASFIGPGETFRIELNLYSSEELTRYTRRWNQKWMPYAVLGGAVAVGVFGALMQVSASSSYDDFDTAVAKCNMDSSGRGCDQNQVISMRDSGDSKRVIGYVGYSVAGAAVIAGLTLLYLNRQTSYQITADEYKKELRKRNAHKDEETAIHITPIVSPDTAGAMILGSF
jgi:tetratricopeptide (TPR) repeat protein